MRTRFLVRLGLFFLLCLGFITQSSAQFNDEILTKKDSIYKQGELCFSVDGLAYFVNQEYFNPMVYSYTMAGYGVSPVFSYQMSDEFQIQAGAYLLNSIGRNEFLELQPVFALNYRPFENFYIQFGSYYGGANHRLVEQMYSYNQAITKNNEEGLSILYDGDHLFMNVWLDWRYLTFPRDDQSEKIFGGYHFSFNHKLGQKSSMEYFTQMVVFHDGGQDLIISHPVRTFLNKLVGFKYELRLNKNIDLGSKNYYIQFFNTIPRNDFAYIWGYGIGSELHFRYKFLSAKVGYWHGNRFYNPLGEFQFSSVSEKSNNIIQPKRSVYYSHVDIQKEMYPGVMMGVRSGMYLSQNIETEDFYIGIFLRFNKDFILME